MEKNSLVKEILDKVRDIEGFPIGDDEDIINLSDPPYYTACPNPWLGNFIKEYGTSYDPKTDNYRIEPFTSDVSEGKHDVFYYAHSYHTKVPPKAIIPYIIHYTNPGDVIFDGFCGSGMTGVATKLCNKKYLENSIDGKNKKLRNAILIDLAPAATHIAYFLNKILETKEFQKKATDELKKIQDNFGWMFETEHNITKNSNTKLDLDNHTNGKINCIIWSDVVLCSNCNEEIILWDATVDEDEGKVKNEFNCKNCNVFLQTTKLEKAFESIIDKKSKSVLKIRKQIPVLIEYSIKIGKTNKRFLKKPDIEDFNTLKKIEEIKINNWHPDQPYLFKGENWGDTYSRKSLQSISRVDQFFTKRNLIILSEIWNNPTLKILLTPIMYRSSKLVMTIMSNYFAQMKSKNRGGWAGKPLMGTIHFPNISTEISPFLQLESRIKSISKYYESVGKDSDENVIISTQSSTDLTNIGKDVVDYIFTDPPFGHNITYSELNFLWESWFKVFSNNKPEAIISKSQKKQLNEYQELMEQCFKENYRILKPGRWMTIVFHNSQHKVWMSIQEAIERSGFVVADVRTLDKKHVTFQQSYGTHNTVKQDLIISCYKPSRGLEQYFGGLSIGTEEGVWKFIDVHLNQLPVFVDKNEKVEIITERQKFLLFDRMIAFHVQKGLSVPISAAEFYEKLHQKYPEREGMFFLSDQIPEYDQKRAQVKSIEQTTIFVEDEKSTILWLNEQLKTPQTYQEIQPKFLKEIHKSKYEKLPELSEILVQNFLENEKGKWYISDPTKLKDLEKLRDKSLLREFQTYQESKGKLKQFRLEAIRAGFKKKWSENNYQSIVDIANKLPIETIQENNNLLMYYDNSLSRV